MGIATTEKYDNKKLSENFYNDIVKNNFYNSELYYRFETFQLRDYLAIKTGNNQKHLDGDITRVFNGVLYHLKKIGFRKSKYPSQYQFLKQNSIDILCGKGKIMKNYHTNDNFTIWEDKDYRYFIQMKDKEIEPQVYDIAADAIEEAYRR